MPTNPTTLTGLDLRRKVLEATGWRLELNSDGTDRFWHVPECVATSERGPDWSRQGCAYERHVSSADRLPAIESDPAVSEPLFLEFCGKRGFNAQHWFRPSRYSGSLHQVILHSASDSERGFISDFVSGEGATPSEARARAILAAVEQEGK